MYILESKDFNLESKDYNLDNKDLKNGKSKWKINSWFH